MNSLTGDELQFFMGHEDALPLYFAWLEGLSQRFPGFTRQVKKTQISFSNRRLFACVSFLRAKRKAEMPSPFMTLSLGLPCPLASDRAAIQTEPYPGRWTIHIVLGKTEELDGELWEWVEQAYVFAHSRAAEKRGKHL